MPKAAEQKVTEEQAGEALRSLFQNQGDEEAAPAQEPAAEPETTEQAPEQSPEGTEVEQGTEETAAAAPESDDVESLRKRLSEAEQQREAREKYHLSRQQAMQQRFAQNEQIMRDRYLRKATVADRALKVLKAARTSEGIPETEADVIIRELEGSMNPASPSYAPAPSYSSEDGALILNGFLNERGMSAEEATAFGDWMQREASTALSPLEQAVAGRDLDGFLRIAHNRFQEGQKEKDKVKTRNDTAEAVRTVQRTQRDAARAASSSTAAPRKQSTGPRPVDLKSLKREDVSALLRSAVEEAKQGA